MTEIVLLGIGFILFCVGVEVERATMQLKRMADALERMNDDD